MTSQKALVRYENHTVERVLRERMESLQNHSAEGDERLAAAVTALVGSIRNEQALRAAKQAWSVEKEKLQKEISLLQLEKDTAELKAQVEYWKNMAVDGSLMVEEQLLESAAEAFDMLESHNTSDSLIRRIKYRRDVVEAIKKKTEAPEPFVPTPPPSDDEEEDEEEEEEEDEEGEDDEEEEEELTPEELAKRKADEEAVAYQQQVFKEAEEKRQKAAAEAQKNKTPSKA